MNRATKSSCPRVSVPGERRSCASSGAPSRSGSSASSSARPAARARSSGAAAARAPASRAPCRGAAVLGRPHRVGVGGVDQARARRRAVPQGLGEEPAEGQRDHPADAVPEQDRGPAAGEGEDGVEVAGQVLQAVVVVVGLRREAQARAGPRRSAGSGRPVAAWRNTTRCCSSPQPCVRTIGGRVRRAVELDLELGAVGPTHAPRLALARVPGPVPAGLRAVPAGLRGAAREEVRRGPERSRRQPRPRRARPPRRPVWPSLG